MTGKKTQLGRILDGAASIMIFIPVYCALVWRCYQYHSIEFLWLHIADTKHNAIIYGLTLFALCLFSGFVCHSGQCRLADYYRQIHLFFLKGESGAELSTWTHQQQLYNAMPWRYHLTPPQIRKGRQRARVILRRIPPPLAPTDAPYQYPHLQHAIHSPLSMLPRRLALALLRLRDSLHVSALRVYASQTRENV